MAILNYVNNLTPVENYIGLTESSNNPNYFKLVFTGDGHIITHGHDYTADYNNGKRGLVPNYEIENYDYGVFTKSGWKKLTSEYLPIDDNNINTTHLWSSDKISKFVEATFADKLKANDAIEVVMREITIEGLLSIQAGENPRVIEEKLKSFLAPSARGALSEGDLGGDE